MEFGALYCKPANPNCLKCIFKSDCKAHINNMVADLPKKIGKVKIKKRYFNYLVFFAEKDSVTWIRKREEKDIWQNLYEFPMIEGNKLFSEKELLKVLNDHSTLSSEFMIQKKKYDYKHILTHQQIFARFFKIHAPKNNIEDFLSKHGLKNTFPVNQGNIDSYGVSRLTDRFLHEVKIF